MMTTPEFDALAYMQRLETAGVPREQAAVHAQALADVLEKSVASPRDLLMLERNIIGRIEIGELKLSSELKEGLAAVRGEVKEGLSALRTEFKEDLSVVKAEQASARGESRMLRWMAATSITLSLSSVSLTIALFLKIY